MKAKAIHDRECPTRAVFMMRCSRMLQQGHAALHGRPKKYDLLSRDTHKNHMSTENLADYHVVTCSWRKFRRADLSRTSSHDGAMRVLATTTRCKPWGSTALPKSVSCVDSLRAGAPAWLAFGPNNKHQVNQPSFNALYQRLAQAMRILGVSVLPIRSAKQSDLRNKS